MQNFTTSWQSKDGLELFSQGWAPEYEPKAVVCLVHGLGEHSGRYAHVGRALVEAGYALVSFDLRGHGRSGGKRGYIPNAQTILEDVDFLLLEAAQRFPGKARFIYGHSLGGLVTLYYTLKRRPSVQGIIASSPGLRTPLLEQKAKIRIAKAMKVLAPKVGLPTGLDANELSHDPEVVEAYRNDPLVHGIGTVGLTNTGLEMIEHTFAHAAQFPAPLLLFHGTHDQIVYPAGSQEFAQLVGCECNLKLWEGMYHETHNEPEKETVLAYMIDWLNSHLPVAQGRERTLPATPTAAG